jgi:hypothetical protein
MRDLESWAEGKGRLVGSPAVSGAVEGQGSWVEGLGSGMVGLGSWTTKKDYEHFAIWHPNSKSHKNQLGRTLILLGNSLLSLQKRIKCSHKGRLDDLFT